MPPKVKKTVKIPLIIFIHELSQSKEIWKPYARELAEKGYSVLAVDLRGHGDSILDRYSRKKYWRTFEAEDWKYIDSEIINAVELLKNNHPQVNTEQVVLIGSSLGACVAIIAGEKQKNIVKGLVLISPFTHYKGMETRVPLVDYGNHPILVLVSKADTNSYAASQELVKYAQGEHEIVLVNNAGHGTFMLKHEPKLKTIIYEWLAKKFPPTEVEIPKEPKGKKSKKESSSSHH